MSDHKVTEHITQTGTLRSAKIFCSCGIVVEDDIRRTPLRVLRRSIAKLHQIAEKSPKKEKKTKKQKPFYNYVDEPRGDEDDESTTETKEE